MTIEPVRRVLEGLGAPYALIGAHAMAARGYPRFTADIDLLTTDTRVLDAVIWEPLIRDGAVVDPRRGDADDPLAGVVHIQLDDESDIDVVVGRWVWEADLIARAERLAVLGANLPVPHQRLDSAEAGRRRLHGPARCRGAADAWGSSHGRSRSRSPGRQRATGHP